MTKQISGGRYMPALGAALALCLGGGLLVALSGAGVGGSSTAPGASALFSAQSAVIQAERALSGDSTAFDSLDASVRRLKSVDTAGWPAEQVAAVDRLRGALAAVAGNRDVLSALPAFAAEIDALSAELTERVYALQGVLATQQQPVADAQLERLRLIAAGLSKDVRQLTLGGGDSAVLTQQMLDGEMTMAQIVRGFENGDPELGIQALVEVAEVDALSATAATSSAIGEKIRDVLALTDDLGAVEQARRQIASAQSSLAGVRLDTGSADSAPNVILAALLFVGLLLLAAMAWIYQRSADVRRVAAEQSEQNDRNQAAIMRLLDELGSLADGDLTTTATVTEDITGAIADSINYAIEQLRDLVATLNDSAITVDGAARQTDDTAQQLSTASEALSNQIDAASQAIGLMATSIEEVSGNAERSSDVARHSVDVAHKGGDAVRRTIEGMNAIRETIQETSKRIKRLGESSQEIGNIVELINDIADQTNILALNASIQASMAGEAGRGFAVVADEVQRLAERSANATKQIEVLVRTIQTDTNEAVVSMERSTTDVVGGALLAENAGAALEEIEQVSNQIASLVQNISSSAREQANAAEAVTRNMDKLQEINSQTAEGTRSTTRSIREMAALAAQLRSAVSGFRLPEPDGGESARSAAEAADADDSGAGESDEDDAESPGDAPFVDQKLA